MFFGPKYDLYAFDIKEMKSDKVVPGVVSYGISADKQKFVVYADGAFSIYKVGKKAGAGAKAAAADSDSGEKKTGKLDIALKTRMKLDRTAEWKQILDEGWRVVKYHFYDPDLHGVDWNEAKTYYEGLLPYVNTRRELNLLMTEMVGELNASHQGVSDGDFGIEAPRASVASLGAKIVLDEKTGYPRFEKIYKGSNISIRERSPLNEEFIKVKAGDYLLAINGQKLEPRENFHKYLVDQTHNKITITTNDKPTLEGAKETTFTPLGSDAGLQYKDWVEGNEGFVDKESSGRIGYMHLPDMMGAGWREFQENFEKYRYKDAIIIDVRFNGGGNIDERIIDYLERRPYQITKTRDESEIERPNQGYYGDIVVLMNQFSFSDAEVFPSAMRERGLGTLIGVKTLGYVIAVSSHRLIDNGAIRKTHTGIWELSTGKQLESDGVDPDIVVESPPEMEVQGRDVQLEKATEFLKEKIKDKDRAKKLDTPIEKR
jgi:tricorn protease